MPDDKFTILKLEGEFVDIMYAVNPEYKADVRFENGKKTFYVRILAALYGMIESALLWYTLYTEVLHKEGSHTIDVLPTRSSMANSVPSDGTSMTTSYRMLRHQLLTV